MLKNWFIDYSSIHKFDGKYWILPCVSLWYDEDRFLETGVNSPSWGIEIFWLCWGWGLIIQKGYKIYDNEE